jgi:hypothetical protein
MIGLIVIALAAGWLYVSAKLAVFVVRMSKVSSTLRPVAIAVAFGLFAMFPFLDELVGRWQFHHLCSSEAVVWVSPNAGKVVAAKSVGSTSRRSGFLIPVQEQAVRYADATTGEVFYTVKAFHTPGGTVMRAGLGLGNLTSCWPEKWGSKNFGLNIDELLKRGEQ